MGSGLTALVLGSGYAAEGHAIALQHADVEVVGLASRNEEVCRRKAESLGIPKSGSDWRRMLVELKPGIVAISTPGGTHREMAAAALSAGCHVYCEKPLATTAADARELFVLARKTGLKTAYAATTRYQPQLVYARELVRQGVVGRVSELELVSHTHQPRLMPYGWIHRLEDGGGRLYNHFPHALAMAQSIVDGDVLAVMGHCRNDLRRAPVGEPVHDLRDYAKKALTPAAAAKGAWADVTSDWSYTASVRIGDRSAPPDDHVTALVRQSALHQCKNPDYVAVYGELGTIHIEHVYAEGAMFLRTSEHSEWETLTVPQRIVETVPGPGAQRAWSSVWSQRLWNRLAADFVGDIRGVGTPSYLTFRDGWIYQEAIEIVRSGRGWTVLPVD